MSGRSSLTWARVLLLGSVVLAFPLATAAVFGWGADRNSTADAVAVVYASGLFLGFSTSLWPLPELRSWSRFDRMQSLALLFVTVSCITHLSWELVWLLGHEAIASARDAAWAYPWWAYIDGGDHRYAEPDSTLLMQEVLSVCNGIMAAVGLWRWRRSQGTDRLAVQLFMAMAVVHLYSTLLYFGTEIIDGLPNVDTSSWLDTWIKFGLANAPWLVFPPVVWAWGRQCHIRRDLPGAHIDPSDGV